MKKLLNDPASAVVEALRGLGETHPGLVTVDEQQRVVSRARGMRPGKVGVVAGGGAGHEPLHVGFVGLGMLDAACSGEIFTSPTAPQIVAASRAADGGAGLVHVVKNYSGDVLNFELAAEWLGAAGSRIEVVLVGDDVASGVAGARRGVGHTLVVEKVVGAAAEAGATLAACAALGRRVAERGRSMGVALTSSVVPAVGRPTFDLGAGEMELGIGIHGEAGRERVALAPAREIAERLVEPVLEDLGDLGEDPVIVVVNGMGGTPLMEQYVMRHEIGRVLRRSGVTVARSLVGSYVTSLEMAGCAVTVVRADQETLRLWDAPVATPALRWGV